MSFLIIIRGPGASGKSTVCKALRDKMPNKAALFSPDFFYWEVCGKEDSGEIVYAALERLVDLYLSKNYNVIVEGILTKRDENNRLLVDNFVNIGVKHMATIKRFFISLSEDDAIRRDETRGHLLGLEKTKEYYKKSIESKSNQELVLNGQASPEDIVEHILLEIKR